MRMAVLARRFLLPSIIMTIIAYLRYGAKIDIKSEVELSSSLSLGKSVQIGPGAKIKASEGRILIGSRTVVGAGAVIGGHVHGVMIGEDCIIGARATIMGVNYQYDRLDVPIRDQGLMSKGPVLIGDNVRIGEGAVILDAVEIENGAVIAPRAVVSGKIRAMQRDIAS